MNIRINYHNGHFTVNSLQDIAKHCSSAAQMHQALANDTVQRILRNKLGDYRWSLEGNTHRGYYIAANWRGSQWQEVLNQNTPRKAFQAFLDRYNILETY